MELIEKLIEAIEAPAKSSRRREALDAAKEILAAETEQAASGDEE